MTARILVVAVLVALLAGCGGSGQPPATTPPATTQAKPKPKPKPKHTHLTIHKPTKLVVTILDGDKRVRVRGARVSLGGKTARTDRHGVTTIRAPRARLAVSVSARGYAPVRTPSISAAAAGRPSTSTSRTCSGRSTARPRRARRRPRRSGCAHRSGSSGAAASAS